MGSILEQCANDAWDVIRGRKKIIGNTIVDVQEESESVDKTETEYGWLSPDGVFYTVEWILIHNPSNMLIKVTRNESKTISKAQKEFLYDFYLRHGDTGKANELYS